MAIRFSLILLALSVTCSPCVYGSSGLVANEKVRGRKRGRKLEGYYNFDQDNNIEKSSEGSAGYSGNGGESYGGGDGDGGYGDATNGYGGGSDGNDGGSDEYRGGSDSYGGGSDGYGGGSDGYGGGSDGYSGGSDSSYGGGSDGYGGSSDTYGGNGDGYGGSDGYGSYGDSEGSDSSSSSGYSGYSGGSSEYSSYSSPSKFSKFVNKVNVRVPIIPVLLIAGCLMYCSMVCTAFMYQMYPESTFTNCCRLSINAAKTVYDIAFNLYHCRLGEIPPIVCAMDDDDDLSDDELERMKPRPGIEKALKIEHRKCITRSELDLKPAPPKKLGFASLFG